MRSKNNMLITFRRLITADALFGSFIGERLSAIIPFNPLCIRYLFIIKLFFITFRSSNLSYFLNEWAILPIMPLLELLRAKRPRLVFSLFSTQSDPFYSQKQRKLDSFPCGHSIAIPNQSGRFQLIHPTSFFC